MSAIISAKNELKWTLKFADGDTRAATLKNPRMSLTLSDFDSVMSAIGNVFIGDANGAAYAGYEEARIVTTTTRTYSDL